MAHFLELRQIVDHYRTEESLTIFQGRLINNDRCAFCFNALHDTLNGALTEVVRIRFHGQAVNANRDGFLLVLIELILCIVTIVASELQDTVSDEVLTSSIALNNSLNQVFRHICIICQQLLRIFRQAVTAAMGQMFYSLSIAMGILVTFGSYMKKDVSIEESTENVEIFDTAIAIMAGLMIIPAVFSFSGGDPDTLQAGPALMFITIPKVFESMGLGTVVGILFFTLVLFAAVTSSIALTESAVSTFEDELGWERKQATVLIGIIMLVLGSLSALGYGPLARFTVFGMQFLDFFDFLTNSVMMPIAAITTCLLVSRVIGVEKIEEEVTLEGKPFRRKRIFNFMIKYLCPIFAAIILISSVANALGVISM